MKKFFLLLILCLTPFVVLGADTNTTVSSTVVTDKMPPTASAPSVVVNNSDVCKSAYSAGIQTGIVGMASGVTVADENCERIKLSRSLYGMGMKVAAISMLCQDARVFQSMVMAGTPCPFQGKIGKDALAEWNKYDQQRPDYEEYTKALRYMERVDNKIATDAEQEANPDEQIITDGNGNRINFNNK